MSARTSSMEPGRGLHPFAVFTAASTFVLVIAGGLVTSTGSGLAVPDWPLSYGTLFPPMIGGILYEHGHRMIAGTVALLTTGLMVWTWLREPRAWVKWLSVAAWATVIIQAVLGGMTVLFLLPMPVSVSHAGVAQIFFVLVVTIALVTSGYWRNANRTPNASSALRRWTLIVFVAVYGQMLLGAWVRHSGSGLAIGDFPLAYGNLIPPLSASSLEAVNHTRVIDMGLLRLDSMSQVAIHFAHRVGAVVVTLAVLILLVATLRTDHREAAFVRLAVTLAVLVAVQVTLGALTVWTGKSVLAATAHVAVGALMSATAATYVLICRHVQPLENRVSVAIRQDVMSSADQEGRAHA